MEIYSRWYGQIEGATYRENSRMATRRDSNVFLQAANEQIASRSGRDLMWQVTWCNCGSAMNFKQHCVQVVFRGRPNSGDELTMEFLSCLLSPVSRHCYEYYVCSAIKCSFGKNWCAGFSRSLASLEGRVCNILKKTHWAWFRISNHVWSAPKWLEIEAAVTGANTATFWFILLSCKISVLNPRYVFWHVHLRHGCCKQLSADFRHCLANFPQQFRTELLET